MHVLYFLLFRFILQPERSRSDRHTNNSIRPVLIVCGPSDYAMSGRNSAKSKPKNKARPYRLERQPIRIDGFLITATVFTHRQPPRRVSRGEGPHRARWSTLIRRRSSLFPRKVLTHGVANTRCCRRTPSTRAVHLLSS
jgi:hypothetical protein